MVHKKPEYDEAGVIKPYNRAVLYTAKASSVLLCIVTILARYMVLRKETSVSVADILVSLGLCLLPAMAAYIAIAIAPKRIERWIAEASVPLEEWVNACPLNSRYMSIAITAGLSLFLELVLIRWQACLFPVFMLHKNFTLLACFCGLGLGYAMARDVPPLLLPLSLPLLTLILLLLTILRFGTENSILFMLQAVPVEQMSNLLVFHTHQYNFMSNLLFYLPVCLLLVMTFALNALAFIPIGQFCGYLMQRGTPLTCYGYNLLGSIGGTVLLFLLSWLWVTPVVWFGLSAALLLWYQLVSPGARRMGVLCATLCVTITAWPVEPMVQVIYSPYQKIEKVSDLDGLMRFVAAGSYFQKIVNFDIRTVTPTQPADVGFWELPYHVASSLQRVLIAGSGVGNDIAGALESGAGYIDAVEIDPAIVALGKIDHPRHPYQDPRVHTTINDGRNFFKNTNGLYDVIVFGGQDTRILLSHGSNIRLDTFMFTEQGLNEAFVHLKPGGVMSLSFTLGADIRLGRKIYYMLKHLPGAGKPQSVKNDFLTIFMVSKGHDIQLPVASLAKIGLSVVTQQYEKEEDGMASVVPSDDWPFFYMDERTFPPNYVVSLLLVLALSALLVRRMLPGRKWQASLLPFFFLGAGFMLVETKTITELGLVFGNTWQVVGITIIGVLVMAYCANLCASRFPEFPLPVAFICLLGAIAAGYAQATHGGVLHTGLVSGLGELALLTSPLFFSGVAFSSLLRNTGDITGAMAYNLMGAMLGGLFEYNSLRFGFAALYIIAFIFYSLAWSGMPGRRASA